MSDNNLVLNEDLDIDKSLNVLIPTGSIILKATSAYTTSESDLSEGVCPCDGRAISRTIYSNLFSVIGTQYGSGNGSTTFNVPTLLYFLSMPTSSANLGTQVGSANHDHAQNVAATGTSSTVSFDHAHYLTATHGTASGDSHSHNFSTSGTTVTPVSSDPSYTTCLALIKL